jgi:NTE family protein
VHIANLPHPLGFVLGGGGSLGAIQVGMLQALAEQGVKPDMVAGTSIGSINGAVVALDPSGAANRLSHAWPKIEREQILPGGPLDQLRTLQRTRTHLFDNDGLAKVIADFLGDDLTFDDLVLPFAAITMDVATARPHLVQEGRLLPALLASAAIPGVWPPIMLQGRLLYDGGVVANVPLRQAQDMGARSLVVLDCAFAGKLPGTPESFVEVLMYTALVTMRSQAVNEAPAVAAALPVVYVPGPDPRPMSSLDFSHTHELIEDSYTAARSFLEHLDIAGPGLYGSPALR